MTHRRSDAETKGELTHLDLWGKYDIRSLYRNQYFLILVDDATRHMTVAFLKLKNHAVEKVLDYLAYLKAINWSPHAIRMDRGTEFVNETMRTRFHWQGMEFKLTAPYSQ